jgi:PhzF family phenazine biosynthesis protein
MGIVLLQIDAFTNQPFGGNPAAVCLLSKPHSNTWMQQVAQEMNLSETAFLLPQTEGYQLRWFTPTTEIDLCGHATLASAHALWSEGYLPLEQPAHFHTHSGLLTAVRQEDWIELNFPARVPSAATAPIALIQALGIEPQSVWKNPYDYLIEVDSAAIVRSLQPDFARLATVPCQGVIVTSRSDTPKYDFVSRFFAPAIGINEDPVTGAAHCGLAPYWQEKLGKSPLIGYQASARGGVVKVRWQDDRVYLAGQATTVLRGELWVQA